jgi:hypothetical protein
MFGGNHDIGVVMVDGPRPPPGQPRFTGQEGDGLHIDLATGEVSLIPAGPLEPRGQALAAIVGDGVFLLWGHANHKLFANGASYRLR